MHILSSLEVGGQERVAVDLAVAQRASGQIVSVLVLAPLPAVSPLRAELQEAGIEALALGRGGGLDVAAIPRLTLALGARGAQVVHTHNPRALIYGAPAATLAGAVTVHTKHGANPEGGRRLWLLRAAALLTDAYVAVSHTTAQVAQRRHEVSAAKLLVVENGIRLDRFAPDEVGRQRARRLLGIPPTAWVVGTVGRLAVEKDQALLLRACAPLLGPDRRLLIVGDGPEATPLATQAGALGIAPWVHLVGARRDVPALLAAMDVFALSSRSEGLPLSIVEAMATALPVVATRVGGVPTVVEEGASGLLVDALDEAGLRASLAELADQPERARSMGARGRAVALARFSAERMARDYLAIYHRALGARCRPSASSFHETLPRAPS